MINYNYTMTNEEVVPEWYRAERYDYCDSFYPVRKKKSYLNILTLIINSFL